MLGLVTGKCCPLGQGCKWRETCSRLLQVLAWMKDVRAI